MTCGGVAMKAGELIDLLMHYSDDDEIEIEVYETISGHYVDTTRILLSWKTPAARFSELMSRQKSFGSS